MALIVHLHHPADLPLANTMLLWGHTRDQEDYRNLLLNPKAHHQPNHSEFQTLIMPVLALLLCYLLLKMG